jgi:chloramphenicol O-acetyltransferase type A
MSYTILDKSKWSRLKHFEFFSKFEYPHFAISVNLEVTETFRFARKEKVSLGTSMLYAVMKAANATKEFRYRINSKGDVFVYDTVHPGLTHLFKDDVYTNFVFDYDSNFTRFIENYRNGAEKSKEELVIGEKQASRLDLIYLSSLPWLKFTHVMNPVRLGYTDSIPRIIYGKYFKEGGKIMMPFSVQVNHCLMDGIHASKYFLLLEHMLHTPTETFL